MAVDSCFLLFCASCTRGGARIARHRHHNNNNNNNNYNKQDMMDSGLGMVQTSNGLMNNSKLDLITPKSLLAWQRCVCACSVLLLPLLSYFSVPCPLRLRCSVSVQFLAAPEVAVCTARLCPLLVATHMHASTRGLQGPGRVVHCSDRRAMVGDIQDRRLRDIRQPVHGGRLQQV